MDPSTTPSNERTYTVSWHRSDGETQTCTHLTPRIAFARLWAAWKESGEITVTEVTPEWTKNVPKTETWPYSIPPPKCQDAKSEGWTCVVFDGTGYWCDACTLWSEEHAAEI
jgi:hypothetical protein